MFASSKCCQLGLPAAFCFLVSVIISHAKAQDNDSSDVTLATHGRSVWSIGFSPDGKSLATGGGSDSMRLTIWDLKTGKPKRTIERDYEICSVAFSRDGALIAAGAGKGQLKVWDAQTGELMADLVGHEDYAFVYCVAFTPSGKELVSTGTSESIINVWDLEKGRLRTSFHYGLKKEKLEADRSGVPGGEDGPEIIDIDEKLKTLNGFALSSDGKSFAAATESRVIRLRSLTTGKIEREFDTKWESGVKGIGISPDDTKLVVSAKDTIQVWEMKTAKKRCDLKLKGQLNATYVIGFSSDSKTLVTRSTDGNARVWDLEEQKLKTMVLGEEHEPAHWALAPDGKIGVCVLTSPSNVWFWDAATGKRIKGPP